MKAQSDLAGDRKRRAEMTRPRVSGATKRIEGIGDNLGTLVGTYLNTDYSYDADTYGKLTQLSGTLSALNHNSRKVIYRPAGRQRPVCTP